MLDTRDVNASWLKRAYTPETAFAASVSLENIYSCVKAEGVSGSSIFLQETKISEASAKLKITIRIINWLNNLIKNSR
jgi:hypothetical protein